MLPENLAHEHLRRDDLRWQIRTKGEEQEQEVKEAYQEPADHLSAIKKEQYRTVQKRDLPRLLELYR